MLALVYWIKDCKTGLVPLDNVPEKNRSPGQIGRVKWTDGNAYPAQIIKISKCIMTLEKAEIAFMKKMQTLKAKEEMAEESNDQSKGRGRRAKKTEVPGSATDVQVSKALGEKIRLNSKLSAEKEKQQKKEKEAKAEADKMERQFDEVILQSKGQIVVGNGSVVDGVRRNLNTLLESGESPAKRTRCVSPVETPRICRDSTRAASESVIITTHTSDESDEEEDENETCNRCRALSIAVHHCTVSEFVSSLSKFCYLPPQAVPEVKMEIIGDDVLRYLKPLPVPPGHKKVELTLRSGLFIKKAKKSQLVVDATNDPYKLTRITLMALYGDQLKLKGVSAKAKGAEKLGVEDGDLTNIYNFVSRNACVQTPPGVNKKGNQKPTFNYAAFIREVNKKLKSCSRDRSKKTAVETKVASRAASSCSSSTGTPNNKQVTPGSTVGSLQVQDHCTITTPRKNLEARTPQATSQGSSRLCAAGTPRKNWQVTTLAEPGRQPWDYNGPNSSFNSNAGPSYSGYQSAGGPSSYHNYANAGYTHAGPGPSGYADPSYPGFYSSAQVSYPSSFVQSAATPSGCESVSTILLDTNTLLNL